MATIVLRGAESWIGFVLLQQLSLNGDTVITEAFEGEKRDWIARNANIQMIQENEWDERTIKKAQLLYCCADQRKSLDVPLIETASSYMPVTAIVHEKEWSPELEKEAQWICHPDLYGPWQPSEYPLNDAYPSNENNERLWTHKTASPMYVEDVVLWIVHRDEREANIQLVNQQKQTGKESLSTSSKQNDDTRLEGFKQIALGKQTNVQEGKEATEKWRQWMTLQKK